MCGIFGGVISGTSALRDTARLEASIERLFVLSESRGKEAAGLAIANAKRLGVYKAAVPARSMIRTRAYRRELRRTASRERGRSLAFIGHSRLVTDGGRESNRNNQPVVTGG